MSTTKVYKNGNYLVIFNTITGTKVRYNDLDYFEAERPESIDLKITNRCYGVNGVLCAMCHENSNECGKHGDILNLLFIDTMLPYSEVAIGGGDPLTHPDLIPFLEKLKDRNIIANITVNQYTFMNNIDYIKSLVDNKLIYGLGISLNEPTDEFIEMVTQFPNAVVHVICGLVSVAQLKKLADNDIKILILGYKTFRRGKTLYEKNGDAIEMRKKELYNALPTIISEGWFNVVSFDNLGIEQLEPKRLMSDKEWDNFFMGNDGSFTMYVDAVEGKFAKSSVSTERWNIKDDIKTMFNRVREA